LGGPTLGDTVDGRAGAVGAGLAAGALLEEEDAAPERSIEGTPVERDGRVVGDEGVKLEERGVVAAGADGVLRTRPGSAVAGVRVGGCEVEGRATVAGVPSLARPGDSRPGTLVAGAGDVGRETDPAVGVSRRTGRDSVAAVRPVDGVVGDAVAPRLPAAGRVGVTLGDRLST